MAHLDLYRELSVDPAASCEEIAGTLTSRLAATPQDDAVAVEELTLGLRILGDPGRRRRYDAALASPSVADITLDSLRDLASQPSSPADSSPSHPPLRGAAATHARTFARTAGAHTLTAARAVDARARGLLRRWWALPPTPRTLTGGAVLAAVVIVVVLAAVAVTSSDGDTTASGPRTVNDLIREARSDVFARQDYLNAGDEVTVTTGKKYTYPDGRTARTGGGRYTVSVDNLRIVDAFQPGDPDAPKDHPDSQPRKYSSLACVDVTFRGLSAPEDSGYDTPAEWVAVYLSREPAEIEAVIDGRLALPMDGESDTRNRAAATGMKDKHFPPGWTGPAIYKNGSYYSSNAADDSFSLNNSRSGGDAVTASQCRVIDLTWFYTDPPTPLSDGEPSEVTGYTVSFTSLRQADEVDTDPAFVSDENTQGKSGWRLNH
ncbi:hypothetical protein [Corynebacterium bovis]|uniref:Uncharacterized protein n=2 Tax=Corynebacterium bovis TaxID=36808 RepID=A0A8H9Y6J8_9CORY|nr:hypothetical protein [Corynebacterium bovis]MBB3115340.1 hypothetical protein [Corynebacterium bovis DSM 20582 = CIP 54.80]QQC48232.1 hypothetical protein I6I09_04965 [Corynebacterium bovis]RRO82201.1 hypothetical protein CXF38_01625 [Corynebacterium bovis]RRO83862.1 hypothetical protein CXF37_04400 [Corynebacterium bovis]RRO90212.1 hypothetical protein CXF45_06270 [Corynebacterium bovis]